MVGFMAFLFLPFIYCHARVDISEKKSNVGQLLQVCFSFSPRIRMHLSLDTIDMVDDNCPSPGNFHEMVKGAVASVGTHVHSIDVILGFTKDPVPLLAPGVHTVGSPGDVENQDHIVHSYGTVSPRDSSALPAFHGQSLTDFTQMSFSTQLTVWTTGQDAFILSISKVSQSLMCLNNSGLTLGSD